MIQLSKILSHLPESKITELETITQRIADTGKAEIVVLYGSYGRGNYKEKRGKERGKKSDYDILVVTTDDDTKKRLQSNLRGLFEDIGTVVQIIVERIDFVNSNLEEKQYFFTDIKREGKILFNTDKYQLAGSQNLTPTRRREIAEEDYMQWFTKGVNSLKKWEYCFKENMFQEASFELQQTVEMCYTTIEMVFTHYNPHEHYLKILKERTQEFDGRIGDVLPTETKEQQELFDYLDFAYIGGRYRSEEEFPVTKEQLDYWSKEAKKLLDLTETICQERIECLKEIEQELKAK